MDEFYIKGKVLIGSESMRSTLARFHRVFIVTDSFMQKSGKISYLTKPVTENGGKFTVYSDIGSDPDVNMVAGGIDIIMSFKPDAVVAFGGGSPIDAAKAIVYLAEKRFGMPRCVFIAVPTTSGTGTEVSKFAVITDRERGIKHPMIDEEIMPDIAVLDPELTCSVPPQVTADTGMDVLTHAIEAYVCTKANPFTDAFAEKAVKIVYKHILTAFSDPNNLEARRELHAASCMAGAAFSNAGLGICHSMAHALGGWAHVPHGRANAILLPYVMSFNAGCETELTKTAERYAELAVVLDMKADSLRQSAINLVRTVRTLNRKMGLPKSIKEAGVDKAKFEEMLDSMAEAALSDRCTATSPKKCTKEDIINLYRQAYNGDSRIIR